MLISDKSKTIIITPLKFLIRMKQFLEAKDQLKLITISEVKDLLKEHYSSEYSKMIIEEDATIERIDYYYSELNYIKSERNLSLLKFPLFDKIKDDFKLFEGGIPKFGEKAVIEYESYLNEFGKLSGASKTSIFPVDIEKAFDFPFDLNDEEISQKQRPYFIPKGTYNETCNSCKGNQYISCSNNECSGKHTWRCKKCIGKGELTCDKCSGDGSNRCSSCSGKGKKQSGQYDNGKPQMVKCQKCIGAGKVACKSCSKSGKVRCVSCEGTGEITCQICYADKERYGMIDCPECLTAGKTAQLMYVETSVDFLKSQQIIKTGADFEIKEGIIKNHVSENIKPELVYKKLNAEIQNHSDEICGKLIEKYEDDLGVSKNDYPLMLKAEIFYQVIPCIQFSYKHILTNEIHQLKIVDIWNFPEVIFPTNAEATKTTFTSITKTIGTVISKLFRTKGFKLKEDKKLEFKLLIYVAKADGKIEEEEKIMLSNKISNLKNFTNREKSELFNLLNTESLPELTIEDVRFYDPITGIEILSSLEELALSDGVYEKSEKEMIEKLQKLFQENSPEQTLEK